MSKVQLNCPDQLFKDADGRPATTPWDAYGDIYMDRIQGEEFDYVDSGKNIVPEKDGAAGEVSYRSDHDFKVYVSYMVRWIHEGQSNHQQIPYSQYWTFLASYFLPFIDKIGYWWWYDSQTFEAYQDGVAARINDYTLYNQPALPPTPNEHPLRDDFNPDRFTTSDFMQAWTDFGTEADFQARLHISSTDFFNKIFQPMFQLSNIKTVTNAQRWSYVSGQIFKFEQRDGTIISPAALKSYMLSFYHVYYAAYIQFMNNSMLVFDSSALVYYKPWFHDFEAITTASDHTYTVIAETYILDDDDNNKVITGTATTTITPTDTEAVWIEEIAKYHNCPITS
jgi:hypothetical protein